MQKEITKDIVVIYHGKCPDGFGAAWAAWMKFKEIAFYLPYFHGEPISVPIKDKKVYCVDLIPDEKTIEMLKKDNVSLTALDHHKSNESKISLISECVFDISRSGCAIAWNYFHPDQPVPLFLKYLQDRDLWQWQMENSREMSAFVQSLEFDFDKWTDVVNGVEKDETRDKYIDQGRVILRYQKLVSKDIVEDNRQLVEFEGHKGWAINSSVLSDEIGELLYSDLPLAVIWQQRSDMITVGLRSDGSIDVSTIAKKYGGGGHKAAAGFELALDAKLPWKVIKENKSDPTQ